jgi:hypothetical protein
MSENEKEESVWMDQSGNIVTLVEGEVGYYSLFRKHEDWIFHLKKAVDVKHAWLLMYLEYERIGSI